jgi:hypothetical protein
VNKILVVAAMLIGSFTSVCAAATEEATQRQLADVERKLSAQERELGRLKEEAGIGFIVLFLFGFVLSMWAMNRKRSGCVWFVLGFIPMINILAGLSALYEENERRKANERGL